MANILKRPWEISKTIKSNHQQRVVGDEVYFAVMALLIEAYGNPTKSTAKVGFSQPVVDGAIRAVIEYAVRSRRYHMIEGAKLAGINRNTLARYLKAMGLSMKALMASVAVLFFAGCAEQTPHWSFTTEPIAAPPVVAQVNSQVNAAMTYQRDRDNSWSTTCPAKGDCEDYALCKARKLIAGGMDANRLQLLVCMRHDVLHAVLVVDGHTALDNLSRAPWTMDSPECTPLYTCKLGTGKMAVVYTGLYEDEIPAMPACVKAARELRR